MIDRDNNFRLLEVNNVCKTYGSLTAVDSVSFAIRPGVCFGLLGPNGAGKTTTIEIIEDIQNPDSGEILYKGKPRSAQFREEIGIQFQETALPSYLTVEETLKTFRSLYQNPMAMNAAIELCSLQDITAKYNDKVSGGQKKRLLLAMALINQPNLIFLDEPSTGLDPQARLDLWEIVKQVKSQGKTIVLTTHYMEEAQALCDDIAIMDSGKIIARGPSTELIAKYAKDQAIVLPKANLSENQATQIPGLRPHIHDATQVEIRSDNIHKSLETLMDQKIDLTEMTIRSPNLEDVFLNLTGRKLRS